MANRPKVPNAKKVVDKSDELLPGFDDAPSGTQKCDLCDATFHDSQSYDKHIKGKKHSTKVLEAKLMANVQASAKKSENEEEEDDDDDETDEDTNEMHCKVCDKYFSGYIPYAAHMKGASHAKNAKKQKLKKKLGDMPDVVAKDSQDDDSDDDGITPKPFAMCKICKKDFYGPESYQMHLKSGAHKKKEKAHKTLQTLKASHQEDPKNSDEDEFFSKCEVCEKSFSGIVPHQIHMKSKIHQKNVEKKKIADEMKEYWVHDETEPGYVCKECKKVFNDASGFKAHLVNNSHEKQKAKAVLVDFLKAHPEVVFVSPLYSEDSNQDSDSEDKSDYYLICKLCHFSFSGPESAKDHVKSSKHLSLKKQKKMQLLLKEKTKKSVETPNNNKSPDENGTRAKEVSVNDKLKNASDNNGHDFELI